jgi:hypothetical protein
MNSWGDAVGKTSGSCAERRSGIRIAAADMDLESDGRASADDADESRGASQASMFNPVRALMGVTSLLGVRDRG